MFRSATRAGLQLLEERLERHAAAGLLRERLAAQTLPALVRELARAALLLDDAPHLACGRGLVEAEDLDRLARVRLLDAFPAVVVERAHAAPCVAGDDRVADSQGAAVDEHRRDRAAADVEARFDDRARRLGARVRARVELDVGNEQDLLEQLVEILAALRGDTRHLSGSSPLLGLQSLLRELAEHAIGVRVRKVDLVDGDDDRDLGRARVRDRLARLRHDAVVGRDDEDRDVRHFGAAGAHRRESLMARRVEEGDLAAVDVGLVGADVLRDAPGLGLDDGRLADRVEERRLPVVDVAHDRHDRRAVDERLLRVLERLGLRVVVAGMLDRDLAAQLRRDQLDLVVGERLGGRLHLPEVHEQLDDLRHRDADGLREVAQGDAGLDRDGAGRLNDLAGLLRAALRGAVTGTLALPLAGAPAALVDDDPALAIARPAAAARPDRSVRSRWHQSSSVEAGEARVDADGFSQRPRERAARRRTFEARKTPARVNTASGAGARRELAVPRMKALQLALGRLPAAAGARPNRLAATRSHPPGLRRIPCTAPRLSSARGPRAPSRARHRR